MWLRAVLVAVATIAGAGAAVAQEVDLALVLAVDASGSVSEAEIALQRRGYASALQSHDVVAAIRSGRYGRIAVTYFEWSSTGSAQIGLPWAILDGRPGAEKASAAIAAFRPGRPYGRAGGRTSISYGLSASLNMIADLPCPATRRVIDISGDGANNDGEALAIARDRVLKARITINGLPIGGDSEGGVAIAEYYAREVIGGPGAFIVPASSSRDFDTAVAQKLTLEIAARPVGAMSVAMGGE